MTELIEVEEKGIIQKTKRNGDIIYNPFVKFTNGNCYYVENYYKSNGGTYYLTIDKMLSYDFIDEDTAEVELNRLIIEKLEHNRKKYDNEIVKQEVIKLT